METLNARRGSADNYILLMIIASYHCWMPGCLTGHETVVETPNMTVKGSREFSQAAAAAHSKTHTRILPLVCRSLDANG